MTAFEELGVLPEIAKGLVEMDWSLPTDIQSEAIPAILGGGDVLMAAETGSGKTGAFCIPIIQIVYESISGFGAASKKSTGRNPPGGGWKMNIFDRDHNLGIDDSGVVCASNHPKLWSGTRTVKGVKTSGKYYYEATIETDGLCRMGWSTARANLNLGTDDQGYGFGGTGKKSNAGQFVDYGESFTLNDVIGCHLDLDEREIYFSKNGKEFPVAFRIRPDVANSAFFPAIVIKNARLRLNFGADLFKFPPKRGFVAVCDAKNDNLVESGAADKTKTSVAQRKSNQPMCLIMEPTKELAQQTSQQIQRFSKYVVSPKLKNVLAAGGISMHEQMEEIERGVDIITCTPGRIRGLVQEGNIQVDQIRFFVLDEADQMLAGQGDTARLIQELHAHIPKYNNITGQRLQMIVCSATLHNMAVQKLANQFMYFPAWIDLKGQDVVPETVHHVVCMIDPREDKSWIRLRSKPGQCVQTDQIHAQDQIRPGSDNAETLSEGVKILKAEYLIKAIDEHKMDQCIMFCRTKLDCDNLERYLLSKGYQCCCLHGDRSPDERTRNLEKFKTKKMKFIICTDVAARGLDISGVPFVINVTLPPSEDKANYVHRIGRVGRAERMGLAISLVSTVPEKVWYHGCKSRGANCANTRLVEDGGCAKWYNEIQYLGEIEEHLGVTINTVGPDMNVPVDEYEGKVTYGSKRKEGPVLQSGHAVEMTGVVKLLSEMEREIQIQYLKMLQAKHSTKK